MKDKIKNIIKLMLLESKIPYINYGYEYNLILYHGSFEDKPFEKFYDNQFYTINEYIAASYAINANGLLYKVKVDRLKPLVLQGYSYINSKPMEVHSPEQYELEYNLIKELYGEKSLKFWSKYGFHPSPSIVFDGEWKPIINWAKENNYDSIKFKDESFDTFVKDYTYLIFDSNRVKIIDIIEPKDTSHT